jgi:hypothetical protein
MWPWQLGLSRFDGWGRREWQRGIGRIDLRRGVVDREKKN